MNYISTFTFKLKKTVMLKYLTHTYMMNMNERREKIDAYGSEMCEETLFFSFIK